MKKAFVLCMLALFCMPTALFAQYRDQNYNSYDYYQRRIQPQPVTTPDLGLGIYEREMYGYGVQQQYYSRQRMPQYSNNQYEYNNRYSRQYDNRYPTDYANRYPRRYDQRYPQRYGNRSGNIIIQVPRIIIGRRRCY